MHRSTHTTPRRLKTWLRNHIDSIPQIQSLSKDQIVAMKAVSAVFPFRVNKFVVDELIDWSNVPEDPIYQLTFPQEGMLDAADLARMIELVASCASDDTVTAAAREIQSRHNPHPSGQMENNVPHLHGKPIPGMQHKYRETVLFFPRQGQTCHAYCTYCFRWAQFVGVEDLKFASKEAETLAEYLRHHNEVNSVLMTGGDPLVMRTRVLRRYIEPLLSPEFEHIKSIRLGTKALSYWPYRFLTDEDSDDLMRLFEEVAASGRNLAIMAHYSHPNEMRPKAATDALRRVRSTGATIRCQAPLIGHVNDSAAVWAEMWRRQVSLGAVPYYMFVERDTGPKRYFEVPLDRSLQVFSEAYRTVSGLARTVRGPSMSATPGKVLVDGVTDIYGEKVFALKFIQARHADHVGRIFFAKYDEDATWLDDLVPALGKDRFFFETGREAPSRSRDLLHAARTRPRVAREAASTRWIV
jgi:KamA family protein